MPLHRSGGGDEYADVGGMEKEFVMEPEYLSSEEIKHELRVRREDARGDRRAITARLRGLLAEERKNPGAQMMQCVGVPAQEYDYCRDNVKRLRDLLGQVTADPVTHDRFMSVLLHLEGRLNRIPRKTNVLDLTQVVFACNEIFSELYNEFLERLRRLSEKAR